MIGVGRCNSSGFQSQMVQSLGLLKTRSEAKYVMTHTITNQVGTLQSEIFIQVIILTMYIVQESLNGLHFVCF